AFGCLARLPFEKGAAAQEGFQRLGMAVLFPSLKRGVGHGRCAESVRLRKQRAAAGRKQQHRAEGAPCHPHYVSITFQFGFFDVTSRSNTHSSSACSICDGLPSIISPLLFLTRMICSLSKRTASRARLPFSTACTMSFAL